MKVIVLAPIVGILLFTCASHDLVPASIPGSFNSESVVRERQEIIFSDASESIAITLLEIEEARCPSDVVCIWQGYAKVSFKVTQTSEAVDLAIPPHQPLNSNLSDSQTFNVDGNSYKLILKDVTPYPSSKNTTEVKRAVIVLERG